MPHDEPDGNVKRDLHLAEEVADILRGQIVQRDNQIDGLRDDVDHLRAQIDGKDIQIAGLMDALRASQEATRAEQVLRAASSSNALESTDQKRSRWRRLVDAWRDL